MYIKWFEYRRAEKTVQTEQKKWFWEIGLNNLKFELTTKKLLGL